MAYASAQGNFCNNVRQHEWVDRATRCGDNGLRERYTFMALIIKDVFQTGGNEGNENYIGIAEYAAADTETATVLIKGGVITVALCHVLLLVLRVFETTFYGGYL